MRLTPEALRALPLRIDAAACTTSRVDVPSYPDEPRPSSVVTLTGAGYRGLGEHVGWTDAAHIAFGHAVGGMTTGTFTVGSWSDRLRELPPYDRAALEAAGLDLALRQASTNLFRLAGVTPASVRYVVSFGRTSAPDAVAQRQGDVELKVDADPAWDDATFATLGMVSRVAVLDWKGSGTRTDHERAHRMLPDALVEDPAPDAAPWSASLTRKLAIDAGVLAAADVASLDPRPAAVNLKPARMGGVLAMLAAAAACAERGIAVYLGGMFELGPGRTQLRTLAALLSPDGPNDIAPIATTQRAAARPDRLPAPADTPGFGDDPT